MVTTALVSFRFRVNGAETGLMLENLHSCAIPMTPKVY